jgi:hypothetical protein
MDRTKAIIAFFSITTPKNIERCPQGNGSTPPEQKGWHLPILFKDRNNPLINPYV